MAGESGVEDGSLFWMGPKRFPNGRTNANQGGAMKCFTCGQVGHRAYDCEQNKNVKKCSFCRYVGSHTENECRKKKNGSNSSGGAGARSQQANSSGAPGNRFETPKIATAAVVVGEYEEHEESEDEVFWLGEEGEESENDTAMAATTGVVERSGMTDTIRITLDSAATIATCTRIEHLRDVRQVTPIQVRVANNQTVRLDRMGTLRLRTTNGSKTITVPDVYHWPGCPVNLISVGSLTRDKSKEVVFGADAAIIRRTDGKSRNNSLSTEARSPVRNRHDRSNCSPCSRRTTLGGSINRSFE